MERVQLSQNLLKYSFGAVILLAGLDKTLGTNLITDWPQYISPFVLHILPLSVKAFLISMGITEVIVAVMMLTKFTRIAGLLSVVWLLLISLNLVLAGFLDIAIRDTLLAISAYVLVALTADVNESNLSPHVA
jgi:hypothetical protein